ncbi:MAG: hypothetical protein KatS3mg013_1312 [Actinomycetota bacterium]|nr:MAG: hypothetical protein KatS3mg013_1312 [Actinomycetota bacterium]
MSTALASGLAAVAAAFVVAAVWAAASPGPVARLVLRQAPPVGRARTGARALRRATSLASRVGSSRRERRRRAAAEAEVPLLLDLLAAGSSAGLSAPLALRRAAEALRGPLREGLGGAMANVEVGARWRDELAALADRLGSADLRRTVAVLARTEALGSSLADATRDLARDVRGARRAARVERARTAPVAMLFPLVFLILPAFLLLTVVPVLLTTIRSLE